MFTEGKVSTEMSILAYNPKLYKCQIPFTHSLITNAPDYKDLDVRSSSLEAQ